MAPLVDVADSVVNVAPMGWPCLSGNSGAHRRNSGGVQRRAHERQKRQQIEMVECRRSAGEAVTEEWPREHCRTPGCSSTSRYCEMRRMDGGENLSQVAFSGELQLPHERDRETLGKPSLAQVDGAASRHSSREKHHGKRRNFFLFEEQEFIPLSPTHVHLADASTAASSASPPSSSVQSSHLRSPAQTCEREADKPPAFDNADKAVELCQSSRITRSPYLPEFCFSLKQGLLHEGLLYLFVLWAAPELLREEFHPSIRQVIDRQGVYAD